MSLSGESQWGLFTDLDKKSLSKDRNGTMVGDIYKCSRQGAAMPQPSGLPWSMQGMSWGTAGPQPGVVEFTASPGDINNRLNMPPTTHCKRKSTMQPNIPSKQLITEEKMAAYFGGLHISGDYTGHGELEEMAGGGMEIEGTPASLEERLRSGTHRIVLSKEMLRIRAEPILPQAILQRLEKPCTSLVLWKPPKKLMESPGAAEDKDSNNNPESSGRSRKSVLVSTNNTSSCMDIEM